MSLDEREVIPPNDDELEELYGTYLADGHLVGMTVAFLTQERLTCWEAEGYPAAYRASRPADAYVGTCSCGAASDRLEGWEEARWWCREHRSSVGLEWQAWLPEERVIDRRLAWSHDA